ncbi:hypothetical protein GCM10010169_58510 [Micromonospora fulviviridis]|nr:hypothetical protein GCM10010169_58510 [Micromonospora fulviviridis]
MYISRRIDQTDQLISAVAIYNQRLDQLRLNSQAGRPGRRDAGRACPTVSGAAPAGVPPATPG